MKVDKKAQETVKLRHTPMGTMQERQLRNVPHSTPTPQLGTMANEGRSDGGGTWFRKPMEDAEKDTLVVGEDVGKWVDGDMDDDQGDRQLHHGNLCSMCHASSDSTVECTECDMVYCLADGRVPEEGTQTHGGCLVKSEVEGVDPFLCHQCHLKKRKLFPFHLYVPNIFAKGQRGEMQPVWIIWLGLSGMTCSARKAVKGYVKMLYSSIPEWCHFTYLSMSRFSSQDTKKQVREAKEKLAAMIDITDAQIILVIETHASTTDGSLVYDHGRSYKLQSLLETFLGNDLSMILPKPAGLLLLTCGSSLQLDLVSFTQVVNENTFSWVLGFDARVYNSNVIPPVQDFLNCILTFGLSVPDSILKSFGGRLLAMEYTAVIFIERDEGGVSLARRFVYGPMNSHPWGLDAASCPKCGVGKMRPVQVRERGNGGSLFTCSNGEVCRFKGFAAKPELTEEKMASHWVTPFPPPELCIEEPIKKNTNTKAAKKTKSYASSASVTESQMEF